MPERRSRNVLGVIALLFAGGWWSTVAWIAYTGNGDKAGENGATVLAIGAIVALIVAVVALDG